MMIVMMMSRPGRRKVMFLLVTMLLLLLLLLIRDKQKHHLSSPWSTHNHHDHHHTAYPISVTTRIPSLWFVCPFWSSAAQYKTWLLLWLTEVLTTGMGMRRDLERPVTMETCSLIWVEVKTCNSSWVVIVTYNLIQISEDLKTDVGDSINSLTDPYCDNDNIIWFMKRGWNMIWVMKRGL